MNQQARDKAEWTGETDGKRWSWLPEKGEREENGPREIDAALFLSSKERKASEEL